MKEKLIEFLNKNLNDLKLDFEKLLEKPKLVGQGDYAFPVFILSKQLKKSPPEIANDICEKLNKEKINFIEKIESNGSYLNFYLNFKLEVENLIKTIYNGKFLDFKIDNTSKILIEYPSPNTNKALHIGHVRNILIGNSLSIILEKIGNEIVRVNMNNDRGIAVCKSMLGYELFFKNESPKSLGVSPDDFISMCYVKFEQEAKKDDSLNKKAQEMLVKWEANDVYVRELWGNVLDFVLEGYVYTYDKFKVDAFDKQYYESNIYDEGKEIVLEALKNKVKGFGKEKDGAIYCDLSDIKLDKKYLLRGDGTTLYMTQDLYLTKLKQEGFKADKNIFVVGKDQEYHFKVLFELIDRLKLGKKENNFHFSYGYVYDKDGKKFSSRKGKVVGANWIYDEVLERVGKNLMEKEISKNLEKQEIEKRAKIIGYSALAFSFLKVNPVDDIKFNIEKALSMTGDTGPYILYTYARIQSILRKANFRGDFVVNLDLMGEREINLFKLVNEYPSIVKETAQKYKLSLIANYLISLSQNFNEFYQNSNILKEDKEVKKLRLVLIDIVAKILKDGLFLLDIETLDEM